MSFEDDVRFFLSWFQKCTLLTQLHDLQDLRDAIEITKHSGVISQGHRRPVPSMASRITGFISRSTTGTAWIKGMNDVERHAELGYQEHLLLKAVLGIMYSGDWLQFIKEALSLRSANIAYRNMNEFLHQADIAANGHDDSIDQHFRSGVVLGVAMNSLILSLLPNRVLAVRVFVPCSVYVACLFLELSSPICLAMKAIVPNPLSRSTQLGDGPRRVMTPR